MEKNVSWTGFWRALKEEIKEMFLPAGHKISKMGKGVSKRTRTFKNSFTTRMQINNKEQEIEKYFLELGHRFYEDHVDNPPLEYRDCMEAIYVLNQEICGAKEHLKLLQVSVCVQTARRKSHRLSFLCLLWASVSTSRGGYPFSS